MPTGGIRTGFYYGQLRESIVFDDRKAALQEQVIWR
jgi:hypothetical protein